MNVRKGFSLVEVLIVMAIVGLLAAIAIPSFARAKETARQNALRAAGGNVSNIETQAQTVVENISDKDTPGIEVVSRTTINPGGFANSIELWLLRDIATGHRFLLARNSGSTTIALTQEEPVTSVEGDLK